LVLKHSNIDDAKKILRLLGFPRAQTGDRSAFCLLALLDLVPAKSWDQASSPMMGTRPIMDWMSEHYKKTYAENSREDIRRDSVQPFVAAGLALHNPDDPKRDTNSQDSVYQIDPIALDLIRSFESEHWDSKLSLYLSIRGTLIEQYAKERQQDRIPVLIKPGKEITFRPGKHSVLVKAVIEEFSPRFAPGGDLIYVGDTGEKFVYFEPNLLEDLGVVVNLHGKMPDVVIYYREKKWLILVEAVTSKNPVDGKRHAELANLFASSKVGLVYVTAFPTRRAMGRYVGSISWETEVWVADAPSHLIHFNGVRFLGPYAN
jgi:hypothetical protein